MLKIDDNLLQELGLGGLPADDKRGLLGHIYETLEMRVGMRLADQMTNEQLDEFEMYFEAKDDAGAFKWLESNFPNYKEIVNEEFEKLKLEVGQSAPQILAAAQQNAAMPQQSAQPQVAAPQQDLQQPYPPAPQQPQMQPSTPVFEPQQAPTPAQPYATPPAPDQPQFSPQPQPQPYQPAPQQDQPWQQPPAGPPQPAQPPYPPQDPAPQQ